MGEVAISSNKSQFYSHIIQALFPLSVLKSSGSDLFVLNSLKCAMKLNLGSITFPGFDTRTVKSIVNVLCSLGAISLHTVNIVLQTKSEAIQYVTELQQLSTEPNAVLHTPADFIWSWEGENGLFVPYSKEATNELNRSYRANKNGRCLLVINGIHCEVVFDWMTQINRSTGKEHEVTSRSRRILIQP